MKILTDLHTHTNVSMDAFSTFMENVNCAAKRGLQLIAVTNHGPAADAVYYRGGVPIVHFYGMLNNMPKEIDGVTVLRGVEANVLDQTGKLDLPDDVLDRLDIVIASCHPTPFMPEGKAVLDTYSAVINNPQVDIIGHLCKGCDPEYFDEIVKMAAEADKLVEINNSSFKGKPGKEHRINICKLLIKKCLEHKAKIVINSDAHFCTHIGDFDGVAAYLAEVGYPEELVINKDKDTLMKFLRSR